MGLSLSKKAMAVKASSTLAITAKAKAMKADGIDIVGFGAGEPDFDTPRNISEAAIEAIKGGFTKYTPASGTDELKRAIGKKFKAFNHLDYDISQIVVSNGGKHSLTNVFQALLNPGDEVIIPAPYWLTYPEIIKMCDGVPVIVPGDKANGYKITPEQMERAITKKTKALIINSPCNPTGMIYHREELEALAGIAVEKDIYVVSDEMYENLVYCGREHVSIASLGEEIYKRTITCSGMSKSYAMTGWRIGYTGSTKDIAKLMGSIQSHQTSNPNSIAQKAALEGLLGPQDTVGFMHGEFDRRRRYMYERICGMPMVAALEPEGAFYVFVDFSEVIGKIHNQKVIESANDAAKILIEDYCVAVVPCEDFGFDHYIRLSYAISMKSIKKGLTRIEEFLHHIRDVKGAKTDG